MLAKVQSRDIEVAELDARDVAAIRGLLKKYQDLPIDLADATLVHIGKREQIETVFTLDSDFGVYRLDRGKAFDVRP